MIPWNQKKQLLEMNTEDSKNKIRELDRNSDRVFGTFTKR